MSTPHATRHTPHATRHTPLDGYRIFLWLAIIGYTILFGRLAFDQHLGMRTHKADLGQIAQAIWNSSRGRFVESTDTGIIASRLTDHVEPMLALISPVLWLWDDVRALLLLQVILVAVGAWPLYELALLLLDKTLTPRERTHIWQIESLRQLTRPMALVLALAYLLAPQLQSAVLTEFHAAPLAVPFILWVFWAIEQGRLWSFVIATLLVATVKEEMALLAAGLGVWGFWIFDFRFSIAATPPEQAKIQNPKSKILSLFVTVAAVTWFYLATFVIVPAHAVQIYDTAESVYFGRYGALGDSPVDIFKSFLTQPDVVWQMVIEPARLRYLWGLAAPFGLLSLLAPEIIVLALPLLLANLLSAYPAQYYGEFHYSAPLVPYFAVSAAYGLGRLWRWLSRLTSRTSASYQHLAAASTGTMALASLLTNARTALRPLIALGCTLWVLGWGATTYLEAGRGPLAARYDPTPITAHHRLLSRFTVQLPDSAAVTATAAVHPHISHRRYAYQFPIGVPELGEAGQADWALLDVTTNTDMAPGDVKHAVDTLLAGEWGVVDGADGFLLLQRGNPNKRIPDDFYDFARGTAVDTEPASANAGLVFVNARVEDWPRWRQTRINPCWLVGPALQTTPLAPQLEVVTPAAEVLYSFSAAAPPALLWYPPEQWQAGEVICLKTLPLYLPKLWGLRIAPTGAQTAEGAPYAQSLLRNSEGATLVQLFEGTARDRVAPIAAYPSEQEQIEVTGPTLTAQGEFLVNEQPLRVSLQAPAQLIPDAAVYLHLVWSSEILVDWPADLAAFVHLRQGEMTIAQADGPPRFFPLDAIQATGSGPSLWIDEWRELAIPATTPMGEQLTLAIGLYDPNTGIRMELQSATVQAIDNALLVGPIETRSAPIPDQACALIPATCASQPGS